MNIAIIGGSGNMGKWSARYLMDEKIKVVITGRNRTKLQKAAKDLGVPYASNIEAVKTADVVILSLPPDVFESVVEEIASHTKDKQLIIDITSVKTMPVDIMHRYIKKGTILGMHPVFGPGAKSLANQNFVLTPVNNREIELAKKIKVYLEERKANVSIMTPQEHDEMMTVVLGLAHFIAIVAADTLLSFDKFQEMKQIGGTTFKLLYTLVESVISEDPQLYASLQMNFPNISTIEGGFLNNTQIWADLVRNKDTHSFADRMSSLRDKLEITDPLFRRAYENMYKVNAVLKPKP